MDPRGRTALVTGGARRLGRAFALALADAGAHVVIHYHSSDAQAAETALEIGRRGGRARTIRADLAVPGAAEDVFAEAQPDILVSSAAIFERGRIADTTREAWDRHMALNLGAPFEFLRAFARSGREGVVVHIGDWRADHPGREHVAYTVAKAGLHLLTRIAARELAPRVRVNALALGAVLPPADGRPLPAAMPRVAVEDATDALLFLVRNDSVRGIVLCVDAGAHLGGDAAWTT